MTVRTKKSSRPAAESGKERLPVEPIIRHFGAHIHSGFFKPAGARTQGAIEFRYVGFDVQQRCAVKNIDVLDLQIGSLDPDQPDEGQADRVGPVRRAGRKQAARFGVQIRRDRERISPLSIKMIQQNEMGEPLQILEPVFEIRKHLDSPGGAVGADRLNGHGRRIGKGAVDDADRF
jgi:hypothetical protein